jgi:hypothetical protein
MAKMSYNNQNKAKVNNSFSYYLKAAVHVVRVIEQCCFNSTTGPFNGQIANFILKPLKLIESRTCIKKAYLECTELTEKLKK